MVGVFVALVFSISLFIGNQFDIEILTDIGVSMAWISIICHFLASILISLVLFAFKYGDKNNANICREIISIFRARDSRLRSIFYLVNHIFAIVFLFLSGFIVTAVGLAVMGVVSRYLIKVSLGKILCSTAMN